MVEYADLLLTILNLSLAGAQKMDYLIVP
jgi:hypothetical protein